LRKHICPLLDAGRITKKKEGHYGPLAEHEASIKAYEAQLVALKLPNLSGHYIPEAISNIIRSVNETTVAISRFSGIRTRVLALLHKIVAGIYYEREFAAQAETIFERYKQNVDYLIAARAGDILCSKIPSVTSRLAEGDEEAVSQALSTCRRILEAFADAIYPATDATVELNGNTLSLDASKHQNRINAYIAERTESNSRRQRLRQNLSNLFDRVSTAYIKKSPPMRLSHSSSIRTYFSARSCS
jgi:hypothetical protein